MCFFWETGHKRPFGIILQKPASPALLTFTLSKLNESQFC